MLCYRTLAVHQSSPIFSTLLLLTQHFSPTTLLRQSNLVVPTRVTNTGEDCWTARVPYHKISICEVVVIQNTEWRGAKFRLNQIMLSHHLSLWTCLTTRTLTCYTLAMAKTQNLPTMSLTSGPLPCIYTVVIACKNHYRLCKQLFWLKSK